MKVIVLIRIFALFLFCEFTFTTCVQKFKPDSYEYEDLLVIDAKFTNMKMVHTVRLSRTYAYDKMSGDIVSNAIVMIEEEYGEQFPMHYTSNGRYVTDDSVKGEIGKKYKLSIQIEEKEYQSEFIELKPVQEVDSLYWKVDDTDSTDVSLHFYAKVSNSQSNYIMWKAEETWEMRTRFVKEGWEDKHRCWPSYEVPINHIVSMHGKEKGFSVMKEIYVIEDSVDKQKLGIKYSFLLKQYSISEEVYDFFNLHKEQTDNNGSLSDNVPVTLSSNVKCVTNSDEIVLGIFQVSAEKHKRIFLRFEDYRDKLYVDTLQNNCSYYVKKGVFYFIDKCCYDCTVYGYSNVPPVYWSYFDN